MMKGKDDSVDGDPPLFSFLLFLPFLSLLLGRGEKNNYYLGAWILGFLDSHFLLSRLRQGSHFIVCLYVPNLLFSFIQNIMLYSGEGLEGACGVGRGKAGNGHLTGWRP